MEELSFDLVVIGAGPGGYEAAIHASRLGMKTAVVEKALTGGTCLNRGCVPTKALLHASEAYRKADAEFELLGIQVNGLSCDVKKMHEQKRAVVDKLRNGVDYLLKSNKIDVFHGLGSIEKPGRVVVSGGDGRTAVLLCRDILIATGAKPAKPPIPGIDLPGVVTSDELLVSSEALYQKLLIIGGGVIGVEFATVYSNLGCKVTIVEAENRILPTMDREISQSLTAVLKKRGVSIHTSSKVENIEKSGGGLVCHYTEKEKTQQEEAEAILVSIGRRADTDGLFLDPAAVPQGLELDRGRILVDENFQTGAPGIYAIGDVIGGIQLAHVATAEGVTAVERMAGAEPSVRLDVVPSCIYTDPEIASVGLSADQAKAEGIACKTAKYSMLANGKSVIENQERGFIKIVYREEDHVILGAQLMCARATDLVSELCTAVTNGLTKEQLARVMRPHPTFCEGISAVTRL